MLKVNRFGLSTPARFTGLELGGRWHLETSPYFARWLVDLLIFFSSDPAVAKPQKTQTTRTNTAQTSGVEKEGPNPLFSTFAN